MLYIGGNWTDLLCCRKWIRESASNLWVAFIANRSQAVGLVVRNISAFCNTIG
jgi:hypothetical protein